MKTTLSKVKYLFTCILFCMAGLKSYSQDAPYVKEFVQNIIPPSPTASEMAIFGNLPVNGSSGAFNYGLPLYTVKSGDISLPVSVNYYSTGVGVDELSGLVGIDWSLSAGGVISRIMKDYPDELAARYYPETIAPGDAYHGMMLRNLARESGFDGEQDWFSFSVNGLSGSFYFDENLSLHILSDNDVKILYELTGTPLRFTFTLIDDKGFKYIFGGGNQYIERNTPLPGCSSENFTYDSAWFLKEIISPTNNTVTFSYSDNTFTYKTNYNSSITYTSACPYPFLEQAANYQTVNVCLSSAAMESKVISSINFKGNSLLFEYNADRLDGGGKSLKTIKVFAGSEMIKNINFSYNTYISTPLLSAPFASDTSLQYRMFLKDIIIKGNLQSTEQEKYAFEHYSPDQLPVRLSYNKDKYGYYNGASNHTAFSSSLMNGPYGTHISPGIATANNEVNINKVYYGMLKKIIYPTGGHTLINYEANSDSKIIQQVNPASIKTLSVYRPYCTGNAVSSSWEWVSDGAPIKLQSTIVVIGSNGCTTGTYSIDILKNNQSIVSLYNLPYTSPYNTNNSLPCTNSFTNYAPICTVAGSTYKITITFTAGAASGQFFLDYQQPQIIDVEDIFYGAGVRVKSVVDVDGSEQYNKRVFYYNKLQDYLSNNTTLLFYFDPVLYSNGSFVMYCPPQGEEPQAIGEIHYAAAKFTISTSASYSLSRQTVSYSAITEKFENSSGGNGAIERVFVNNPISPGQAILGHDIYDSPASNYGDYFKDKIAEETVYDKQNNPLNKKNYDYLLLSNNYLPSTIVRRNYKVPGETDWDLPGVGWTDVIPYFNNFSIWRYKNHYGVIRLISITEQNYFNGNIVESITTKSYGNPYYQLQSETTVNSLGEMLQTTYQYPADLIGVEQSPYMQQLVDNHRISTPVITKTFNGSNKLIEKHIKFGNSSNTGNLLLPTELHTRKGSDNINIATIADRKLQFSKYDVNGNILEYKPEDDIPVSIIWGYNGQYPIAQIQNALYAQVSSYATSLLSLSNNGTLTSNSFASLRNALPNTMITTFIYKPLVGITTVTDVKEDRTTYTYDNFGRLISVKDKNGNLLSENQYNYRP